MNTFNGNCIDCSTDCRKADYPASCCAGIDGYKGGTYNTGGACDTSLICPRGCYDPGDESCHRTDKYRRQEAKYCGGGTPPTHPPGYLGSFDCDQGKCRASASGKYGTLFACQQSCIKPTHPPGYLGSFDCDQGKCKASASGKYGTLFACQQSCIKPTHPPGYLGSFNCDQGQCKASASGKYGTLKQCKRNCKLSHCPGASSPTRFPTGKWLIDPSTNNLVVLPTTTEVCIRPLGQACTTDRYSGV